MREALTSVLTACLVVVPLRAASAAPGVAPSVEERMARAQELFTAGEYAEAAKELERGYAASPTPRILVGWAQAEKHAGNCSRSLELYEQFLAGDPPAEDVAKVQPYIDECREEIANSEESGAAPTPPRKAAASEGEATDTGSVPTETEQTQGAMETDRSSSPADATTRPWHRDPLGGVLVGVGAAFTLTGIGLAAAASVQDARVDDIRLHGDFEDGLDRALLEARLSYAAFAIGGALVVGGAVRYVVVARRGKRSRNVAVLPGPTALVIRGKF